MSRGHVGAFRDPTAERALRRSLVEKHRERALERLVLALLGPVCCQCGGVAELETILGDTMCTACYDNSRP